MGEPHVMFFPWVACVVDAKRVSYALRLVALVTDVECVFVPFPWVTCVVDS
jgi:hypothetical protein